jgi:tRNA (mo5U34)-methyltransferase
MLASRDEIQNIYRIILEREPSPVELDEMAVYVQEARVTSHQLALTAMNSEEFRRKYSRQIAASQDPLFNREEFAGTAAKFIAGLGAPAEALPRLGARWFHSFQLSDGTSVKGVKSLDSLESEFDLILSPLLIEGETVLDIGAWNGAFSFEAKRRGAVRVLATDLPTWTNPTLRGFEKFLYVRRDQELEIEYKFLDISEISIRNVGRFDIVLFLGVFYHLQEPISILRRLFEIVDGWLVLETHLDLHELPYPAMRYYPGDELGGDPTNWWGPNQQCVEALLRTAGFSEVNFKRNPQFRDRGIFHARK